jgi:hypothetical protein
VNYGFLLFGAFCGWAGWREADRFRQQNGRSPWGWDPIAWGVLCFMSLVLGAVLLAIARRRTPAIEPAPGAMSDSPGQTILPVGK